MFSKILVAYDGSPASRSALTQAYELAQEEDADVTILTVAPTVAPLQWAKAKLDEAKATAPAGLTVHLDHQTEDATAGVA